MGRLRIEWDGSSREFSPDAVVHVGRADDNDVVLGDPRVSRHHLELEWRDGWVLTDRSSGGTFAHGARFEQASIPAERAITLGGPDGVELRLVPIEDAVRPLALHDANAGLPPATITVGDTALRLRPEGASERVFVPGTEVTVGRDPECDVVISDSLASRRHVRFVHDGGHWILEDLKSTRGTYVDGRRLRRPMKAEGVFSAWLGGMDAGAELGVITAGEHSSARSRLPLVLSAAAVIVALVVGTVVLVTSGGNGGSRSGTTDLPPVARLAKSVVLVEALTADGRPCKIGSGSVLGHGLVLTNFHVVAQQEFQTDSGQRVACGRDMRVLAGDGRDQAPADVHAVEVVEADPSLDLAVLRVKDAFSYPAVKLGDSSLLGAGDAVRILGYPAIGGKTLTVTDGIVSGFEADRAVGRHAWIKTDTSIAPGNSGGAAFDAGGSLIGVPTAGVTSTDCHGNSCATVGSINLVRPIDFAKDLVRRATTAQPIPFGDPRLDYGRLDAGSGSGA